MVRELARWGVVEDCVRLGFPYRRRLVLGQDGRQLLAIEAARLAGDRYPAALGITHSALHEVLQKAAAGAGVHFHWDAPVRLIEEFGGVAALHFDDAPAVRAELVVLACGARASLRQSVYGPVPALEQVGPAWRYLLASRPARLSEALLATGRKGRKAQVVPVSAAQAGVQLRLSESADPADLKDMLASFADPVGTLVPVAGAAAGAATRAVQVGMLPDAWNRGPILAVGDCAHALAPHFGQSAAMAAEDATVLGELLAAGMAPAALIDAFVARRAPRALQVMQITLQAARWDLAPQPDMDLRALWQQLTQVVAEPA
jgi:2-polyprenyl-6-methoxyphenol hydroxylase-like FAD-dependent oxidoreductase